MPFDPACPMCKQVRDSAPNPYWTPVAELGVCTLALSSDQKYRGACLLMLRTGHAVHLTDLDDETARAMWDDLRRSLAAIESVVKPELMNVMQLGNIIRHLHWHLVPRQVGDVNWGKP